MTFIYSYHFFCFACCWQNRIGNTQSQISNSIPDSKLYKLENSFMQLIYVNLKRVLINVDIFHTWNKVTRSNKNVQCRKTLKSDFE